MEEVELCFPQLLNTSCRKPKHSSSHILLLSVLLSVVSFLTVSLNLLVIIAIVHFRQLHTSTNMILLSLAFSDFFVGFLFLFQLLMVDGCWYLGNLMCALFLTLDLILVSASVGNMVLISIDRYVAICDPLHYPTKVTLKRARVSVSLCWTCSLIYSTVMLRENLDHLDKFSSCAGDCTAEYGPTELIIDLFSTFLIPITVIIVLYVIVFVVALSQIRVMRSHVAALTNRHSKRALPKKSELKAARTLGVVIIVFLLCLCPYFCISISSLDILLNNLTGVYVISLFYFNSCLNPLIYALFYPWFRRSIKIIVTLKIFKSGSSNTNLLQP
ncbi:trace amine-associated receptor 13c-like [Cyprinodon tularosa]|uniref:trace amine-associated receptor 13c-like n=1 Tax=Cyprinodon tularosa TaxID=77115 RepID=UPI0018E1E417|nr:trace amine-associated receptor 13c-like [Cyprinodon tularosa]